MLDILKQEYNYSNMEKVSYYGYSFIDESFREFLASRVKTRLLDEDWTNELKEMAVEITGFSSDNFEAIFDNSVNYSSWRIGEAIAESILEDSGLARLYYDSCRDLKNPSSNSTGADIVGFCDINNETLFLFGEVKTSSSKETPPSVLYGRTGMIEQLSDLQTKEIKRNNLVKWLTSKIPLLSENFKIDLKNALSTYIKSNKEKVQLVGVLVRDTIPNELDLKNRAKSLEKASLPLMGVWLFALYTGLTMENDTWKDIIDGGVTNE